MPLDIRVFTWLCQCLMHSLEYLVLAEILDREAIIGLPLALVNTLTKFWKEILRHVSRLKINWVSRVYSFLYSLLSVSWLIFHEWLLLNLMIALS